MGLDMTDVCHAFTVNIFPFSFRDKIMITAFFSHHYHRHMPSSFITLMPCVATASYRGGAGDRDEWLRWQNGGGRERPRHQLPRLFTAHTYTWSFPACFLSPFLSFYYAFPTPPPPALYMPPLPYARFVGDRYDDYWALPAPPMRARTAHARFWVSPGFHYLPRAWRCVRRVPRVQSACAVRRRGASAPQAPRRLLFFNDGAFSEDDLIWAAATPPPFWYYYAAIIILSFWSDDTILCARRCRWRLFAGLVFMITNMSLPFSRPSWLFTNNIFSAERTTLFAFFIFLLLLLFAIYYFLFLFFPLMFFTL